jgi:Fe-S cluster biogenesis protein NfuA
MFIQTELTPNPQSLKFLPGITVLESGTASFDSIPDAMDVSPLALALLRVQQVQGVFFGEDFVTITKAPDADWDILKPALLAVMMEHFITGAPVMQAQEAAAKEEYHADDAALVKEIKELIETRVRPSVAQDGGDIIFRGFEKGVVKLQLKGACSGCPSSTMTLKNGIENMLRHYVPEVEAVEAVA